MDLEKLFGKQALVPETWYPKEGMERMCSFVSKFKIKRGSCVLNIGPRTVGLLPILKRKVRSQGKVLALDHSYDVLENAKRRRAKVPTLLFQGNADSIPLPDDSCDYIICFGVFPTLKDKKKAFLEMARVLRHGGKILIAHIVRLKKEIDKNLYVISNICSIQD